MVEMLDNDQPIYAWKGKKLDPGKIPSPEETKHYIERLIEFRSGSTVVQVYLYAPSPVLIGAGIKIVTPEIESESTPMDLIGAFECLNQPPKRDNES